MAGSLANSVRCIYIDPPYNTASSAIPYKNDYKHSSFATLMRDRVAACRPLLRMDGAIFVSIDKTERTVLEHALDDVFGADNHIEELIWTQATANSQLPNYSTNHEYVEVYARDRASVEADVDMFREPKPGFSEVMELVARLNPTFPPIAEIEAALKKVYEATERSTGRTLKRTVRNGMQKRRGRTLGEEYTPITVVNTATRTEHMFPRGARSRSVPRSGFGVRFPQALQRRSSHLLRRIQVIQTIGTTNRFIR